MNSEESPASPSDAGLDPVRVHCRNVGGITDADVSIPPGVTVLSGRNATNRTSFLRGVMGALGSDDVSLKGDADEGRVELEFGDETYTRTLRRTNGGVALGGDPFLDDSEKADLFAFLLESNEARRAVARGDDLREIIMRPVDTAEIRAEIRRLEANKRGVDETLDELADLEDELPELEEQRTRLESEIESKREALREKEAAIDEADASLEESREKTAEIEERLEDLRSVRSSLEDVRFKLDTQRESLDALETERSEAADELSDVEDAETDAEDLEAEIDRLRGRRSELEAEIGELQSLIRFNEEQLEEAATDLLAEEFDESSAEGSVTDQLVEDESVTCWTCGTEVERSAIEGTLDRLRGLLDRKTDRRSELEERLSELTEKREDRRQRRRERRRLESRLDEIEEEIDQREGRIDDLEARRADLEDELARLEDAVDEVEENAEYRDLVDLHTEANRVEIEIERTEDELASVEERIADVEERLDERERLAERREGIDEQLTELRTRIESLETEAVESFNEHMATVLDRLEYANLERIWIERRVTGEDAGPTDRASEFDLHVVRTGESGSAYEDTVDHLSESEREVTGLVFALAGYLAHEVYAECPFMLLDSLEAIDSGRIDAVVDYVSEYTDYLVVALLPEDADAITVEHERVAGI
jgi:DNA repair exonuclease SbcCD ATPase subunit